MRSFVIVVVLGFLATIAAGASTKRDPQSTNQWRPGKKDDTNLFEDRYEEDSSYKSRPNEWNLDESTSPVLGDQEFEGFKGIPPNFPRPGRKRNLDEETSQMLGDEEDFKGDPPVRFPRPGRKRSNFDLSDYTNYPAGEYSRGLGNGFSMVRPGRKRRSLVA